MKSKAFLIAILFFMSLSCWAQNYRYRYLIILDNSYKNYQKGANDIENYVEFAFRDNFLDSTTLFCIGNDSAMEIAVVNKQHSRYSINHIATTEIPDTILPNGASGRGKGIEIHIDTSTDKTKFIVNKRNKILYSINNTAESITSCQYLEQTRFVCTDEKKSINNLKCKKWIPSDEKIKDEVQVWICETIPKAITVNYISDDFTGGVVEIDFKNGRKYRLVDFYITDSPNDSISQDIQCDRHLVDTSNFIKTLLNNNALLDVKYEFK